MIIGLALLVAVFVGRADIGLMDGGVLSLTGGVSRAGAEEKPGFAWHANRPNITRAQIALGRAAALKFEFTVPGGTATNVKFGIPKKFVTMGIKVESGEVQVQGGMASSKALFTVPPGMPLGKFDMPIIAVDAATGKEIGRGTIPFMLLPAGVGGC
ncbi:MAG: hypothetical protein ACYC7L_02460 [Nitrospirota bacterium]